MSTKTIIAILILVGAFIALKYDQPSGGKPSYKDMPLSENSYVTSRVNLSPLCPVETIPPNPDCKSRGYATSVVFKSLDGAIVETVNTDNNGYYSTTLKVGSYIAVPKSGDPYPLCQRETVIVPHSQHNVEINLSCDSGIR